MLPIKKKIAILGGKLLQTFTARSTGKELLSKKLKRFFRVFMRQYWTLCAYWNFYGKLIRT